MGERTVCAQSAAIPIVAFGIGAQAPARETEPDQRCSSRARLYRRAVRIARRAWHVHGRGALAHGIRNARIVGCPTVFRKNDPTLRIDLPPLERIRHVGYTLRREVVATTPRTSTATSACSVRRSSTSRGRSTCTLWRRGKWRRNRCSGARPRCARAALGYLRDQGWLRGKDDPLEQIYRTAPFLFGFGRGV